MFSRKIKETDKIYYNTLFIKEITNKTKIAIQTHFRRNNKDLTNSRHILEYCIKNDSFKSS